MTFNIMQPIVHVVGDNIGKFHPSEKKINVRQRETAKVTCMQIFVHKFLE
jgi:hypothetical protein